MPAVTVYLGTTVYDILQKKAKQETTTTPKYCARLLEKAAKE